MRKYATATSLAAALLLTACDAEPAKLPPADAPVEVVDDCPDGQPRVEGEICK